jgi:hypothetical protein
VSVVISFARVGCVCTLFGAAHPAFAQQPIPPTPVTLSPREPAQRPVRPVFGTHIGPFDQSVTAGLSIGSAFDVERAEDPFDASAPPLTSEGQSAFGNAHLSYFATAGRLSGGASARSAGFYFQRFGTGLRISSGFAVNGTLRLWRNSRLSASHDVTYAPYHLSSLSPAELLLQQQQNPQFDPSSLVLSSLNRVTSAAFDQPMTLTDRVSGSVGYAFHMDSRGGFWGHEQHQAHARVSIGLTRGLAARIGYQHVVGRPRAGGAALRWMSIHNIDSGIDFNRRLSFSRRISLGFRTGLAAIGDLHRTQYTVTGGGSLNWHISRTWNANTGVAREVQFVNELSGVGIANTVHAGVAGALTERLSMHGRFSGSDVDVGLGPGDERVRSVRGSVGLTASISRLVSVGVDYSRGHHTFGRDVALFPGVPRERYRHAVQARVTIAAPLFVMTRSR